LAIGEQPFREEIGCRVFAYQRQTPKSSIPKPKALGHPAPSQSDVLGENEPHPMGSLTAGPKFIQDSLNNGILSLDEVLKPHTINPI